METPDQDAPSPGEPGGPSITGNRPYVIVHQANGVDHPVATIDRLRKLRDHLRIAVSDPRLDWRVVTAVGVATDAFMNR